MTTETMKNALERILRIADGEYVPGGHMDAIRKIARSALKRPEPEPEAGTVKTGLRLVRFPYGARPTLGKVLRMERDGSGKETARLEILDGPDAGLIIEGVRKEILVPAEGALDPHVRISGA